MAKEGIVSGRVEPALASEQRPVFKVGDRVTAQGCNFMGETSGCSVLTGELTSLDASANGHPDLAAIRGTLVLRSTLRHEPQPAPSRPACDAVESKPGRPSRDPYAGALGSGR